MRKLSHKDLEVIASRYRKIAAMTDLLGHSRAVLMMRMRQLGFLCESYADNLMEVE